MSQRGSDRSRGEASSSTGQERVQAEPEEVLISSDESDDDEPVQDKANEPAEEGTSRQPSDTDVEEFAKIRKKYLQLRAKFHAKNGRRLNIPAAREKNCLKCAKRFDDVVRQVHADLLSRRITMVGVTLTHNKPSKTRNRRIQTSPVRVEALMSRDFAGGPDSTVQPLLAGGCQCQKCLVEHRAAHDRAQRHHSRYSPYPAIAARAHSPCEDEVLTDLHQHVLAGDKKTPGSMYVGILSNLHDQGPCLKNCKLKADVAWMRDRIPKQAETQTELSGEMTMSEQSTQTNLIKNVGVQKGNALARRIAARPSWYRSAATQLNLPDLTPLHRPVNRVVGMRNSRI